MSADALTVSSAQRSRWENGLLWGRRVGLAVALLAALIVSVSDVLMRNSLLVSVGATLLAGMIGYGVALRVASLQGALRWIAIGGALTALMLPPFLVVNCWLDVLGNRGIWGETRWFNIYSHWGVVLVLTSLLWPIAMLSVLASWSRLDPAHLETDGALGGVALIRWVLWPASRNFLGIAMVVILVLALNNISVPAILQVDVYPVKLWLELNTKLIDGGIARYGLPLVVGPLLLVLFWGRRREWWPALADRSLSDVLAGRLGRHLLAACSVLTFVVLGVSVLVPLVELIVGIEAWAEFRDVLKTARVEAINSVFYSFFAATISIGMALIGWRWWVGPFVWFPFLVPGVLVGLMLIYLFNRPGLDLIYRSSWIMVVGMVVRYGAIAWSGVVHAMSRIDRDLVDAARLSGASWWEVWKNVQFPQVAGTIGWFWYLTYLLCLWDVGVSVLIQPPGGETVALRAFNLLHYDGHNPQVNGLCFLLLLLALAPLFLWQAIRGVMRLSRGRVSAVAMLALIPLLAGCGEDEEAGRIESRFFESVEVIGTRGTGAGEFNKPRSVAVDGNDNLYVADMTGRVQKFSPDGEYIQAWQFPETDRGRPKGMCRDQDGNIIVVEPHYGRINHYAPDGKLIKQWGTRGTNVGQLAFPRAVAVNSQGDILLSEYGPVERVQKFSELGRTSIMSTGQGGRGNAEFNRPEGLGLDAADRIYVADSCNHRVQVLDADMNWLRTYGGAGGGVGEMSYPYDVRVDSEGHQYVCEFGNSRIQVFGPDFEPIEVLGGVGRQVGQFSNPWSLAMDSQGNLYVADSGNHRVQKFIRR